MTVGERAAAIAEGARSVRPEIPCHVCHANEEAAEVLKSILRRGDIVLVKGSRGMHTDEIVKNFGHIG